MLKTELIKALVDDVAKFGDGGATVCILGNTSSVEINICGIDHYGINCDIDNYKEGAYKFLKDVKSIDDFDEML